jgi:hypothetical protein
VTLVARKPLLGFFVLATTTRSSPSVPFISRQSAACHRWQAADGLQPMERALLLQASPLTAGATSAQVMRLAMIARESRCVSTTVTSSTSSRPMWSFSRGCSERFSAWNRRVAQ